MSTRNSCYHVEKEVFVGNGLKPFPTIIRINYETDYTGIYITEKKEVVG